MVKTVSDVTDLKPIVDKTIGALYGDAMQNIKLLKAEQFPLFKEPKEGWLVHAEFDDGKYDYSVQIDVQIADGRITRAVELHRIPLKE